LGLLRNAEHGFRLALLTMLLFVVFAFLCATGIGFANPQNTPGPFQDLLMLEIQLAGGRVQFHLGEIIPVDLIYKSTSHNKVPAMLWDCPSRAFYDYHVEPPAFSDRGIEFDAAMSVQVGSCGGPLGELDLSDTPLKYQHILNSVFRPDVPGKYHLFIVSRHLPSAVTSNAVDLEILPSDPDWEASELSRAISLINLPTQDPGHQKGCEILRFLGTDAAELEMPKQFVSCGSDLSPAIISARNRKSILEELEAGFTNPDFGISSDYIRTTAFVSLYIQHPDWYPTQTLQLSWPNGPYSTPMRSKLWSNRDAVVNEELRYATLLHQVLPKKSPDAYSKSDQTLKNLELTLGIKWRLGY